MANPHPTRREFLKYSAVAGLGATVAALPGALARGADLPGTLASGAAAPEAPARAADQKPVHALTTRPLDRVRVAVIGLHRGMEHVHCAAGTEFADVVAVCDVFEDRAKAAADLYEKARGQRPALYSGSERVWEQLVDREDIDAVYIATPWAWHVPMALRALEHGKHAFVEVPAALTVGDCWRLVDASERSQRHLVLLENCCYGENELFVLNLARQGVFGEPVHAECAYLHDLRTVLFQLGGEGDWRRGYHTQWDGNIYPTHGLGPVAQRLELGRGDQFRYLSSVSSPEASLTRYRNRMNPNGGRHSGETYVCGDINTTIIKTERGRTILLQHDVVLPRPYSRIDALYGTEATFFDYPPRLSIDEPKRYGLEATSPDQWLTDKDMAVMRDKFTHPLWKKLVERAKDAGHGGMDFVMNWRLLDCLRRGATPDSVVYDAAAWSSMVELTVRSVAQGSMPVAIPDFTRGLWQSLKAPAIADPATEAT
jgi:hypothetical protein